MPSVQPFWVPDEIDLPDEAESVELDQETTDTFELYHRPAGTRLALLTRKSARALPTAVRLIQPTAHLWPTQNLQRDLQRTVAYVERGRRPSQHRSVSEETWQHLDALLPDARRLAGTFATRSGPNCFGTVMGAAGVTDAADTWMEQEPFDAWLRATSARGGLDDEVGTVMVWRDSDGVAAHAGVTLGNGWFLHKPSQGWMSPVKVLTVRDGKFSARYRGLRLHRYRLHRD